MAEQKIEFRKIRDFGENINDTFVFIRNNLRPLLLCFFAFSGFFLFGQAIISAIVQSRAFGAFNPARASNDFVFTGLWKEMGPGYLLLMLFGWLTYTAMKVAIGSYIKYYVQSNGEQPRLEDCWPIFKQYFFRVLFFSIPIFFIIVGGYLLCIIPGIYLTVVFVPFEMVLMMEDASFGAAWERCFALIKENFWVSLGTYLIAGIIYGAFSGIVSVSVSALQLFLGYFTTKNIEFTAIITSLLNVLASVFYIIFLVSVALHYFNLVERLDGTGILKRIDHLGERNSNFDNIEEEF